VGIAERFNKMTNGRTSKEALAIITLSNFLLSQDGIGLERGKPNDVRQTAALQEATARLFMTK